MPKISFLAAMEVVQNVVHGQTDRPTDKATYRSSQPELKNQNYNKVSEENQNRNKASENHGGRGGVKHFGNIPKFDRYFNEGLPLLLSL